MTVETMGTISALNSSWPQDADDPTEGAQHIRDLKGCLKAQFTAGGSGLTGAVTVTHTELNTLAGASSGSLIAAGTVMCFYQAAAPTGWTGSDALANNMLRVVTTASGNGGAAGGSDSPILMDKVPSHTHTFTSDSSGAHGHYFQMYNGAANSINVATGYLSREDAGNTAMMRDTGGTNNTAPVASGAESAHTHTGTTGANGSAANWTPLYASVIIATKD